MYQLGSQKHNQSLVPFLCLSLIICHFCANNSYMLMFVAQHPLMLHLTACFDPLIHCLGQVLLTLRSMLQRLFVMV